MANNQYINKVIQGDQTLIDLTSDSVTTGSMLSGTTAHDATGALITGTIPSKTVANVSLYWDAYNSYHINIPQGYYSTINMALNGIKIPVPSSGTNTFYIDFPNNSAPASDDDWTRITFSVDSNGNSNITDDTIPATGVSF